MARNPADRPSRRLSDREIVAERAKGHCEYCRSPENFATQRFSVEHIHPKSRGGETVIENLAFACPGCNGHKYNKTRAPDPADGKLVAPYNPRMHGWQDHFKWNADFTRIVALTPIGRATVSALQMNRQGVVNMRGALFAIGAHPAAIEDW